MLLVYSHRITPRIRYIFKHILTRTLLIPVSFTSKVEDFVAHNGLKLSYTKTALGNEFFIKSNDSVDLVQKAEHSISTWQLFKLLYHTQKNQEHINFGTQNSELGILKRNTKDACLMQWCLLVQEYKINLHYLPGKENIFSDALSRLVDINDNCATLPD